MKKYLLALGLAFVNILAFATIPEGFYRVQNNGSKRWVSVVDNKGSIDWGGATADLHAMATKSETDALYCDPSYIIYISKGKGTYEYDISAQGMSFHSLMNGHSVNMAEVPSSNTDQQMYRIWGSYNGVTKYVGDRSDRKDSYAQTLSNNNSNYAKWFLVPVDVNTSNFFAANPTIKAKGKNYAPMFASFAYLPYSDGVKAYYVGRIGNGIVEMLEVEGVVPPGSPVIIECPSTDYRNNKLELVTNSGKLPSNILTGVYFNYESETQPNQVAYNPDTMRVLGVCKDGSLGFIKDTNLDYIPANSYYINLPAVTRASYPDEYKCVDAATFAAGVDTIGMDDAELKYSNGYISAEGAGEIRVVNMSGQIVARAASGSLDVTALPKGVYVALAGSKSLKFLR